MMPITRLHPSSIGQAFYNFAFCSSIRTEIWRTGSPHRASREEAVPTVTAALDHLVRLSIVKEVTGSGEPTSSDTRAI
jgi:hypothetical protein